MKKVATMVITIIILCYCLFTSGLMFEMAGSKTVASMDMPYAIAMSNSRLGLIGVYEEADVECAEWLWENRQPNIPIRSDYFGYLLFLGYNGIGTTYYQHLNKEHYLFLGTWNKRLGKIVLGWDAGAREYVALPDISNMIEIYRKDDAVVYKTR